jgi:valine dehydrogenase (NAD+)
MNDTPAPQPVPFPPAHEEVVTVWRRRSGLHAVVAIHSTVRGPALGGTRFHWYPTLEAATADALNLSEAMTYKAAVAGLALGGGKAVLIGDPERVKTPALMTDYAGVLNDLEGRYITAEDVGTSQDDMDALSEQTKFVAGTSLERGGSGDPSPLTAFGVVCAMGAAAAVRWGSPDLAGRHVAVSGVGKVGGDLARLLLERGCRLTVADTSADAVARVAGPGVEVAAVERIHATACDVYAPCALGGAIDDTTVAELRCELVVGAANNQLARPDLDGVLSSKGITYVPDYVANAGGLITSANEHLGYDYGRARAQVACIAATTETLLRRAEEEGVTPLAAAEALARERLAAGA